MAPGWSPVDVDDRIERLPFNLNRFDGILGRISRACRDDGNRLTHEKHAFGGEKRPRDGAERPRLRLRSREAGERLCR